MDTATTGLVEPEYERGMDENTKLVLMGCAAILVVFALGWLCGWLVTDTNESALAERDIQIRLLWLEVDILETLNLAQSHTLQMYGVTIDNFTGKPFRSKNNEGIPDSLRISK